MAPKLKRPAASSAKSANKSPAAAKRPAARTDGLGWQVESNWRLVERSTGGS